MRAVLRNNLLTDPPNLTSLHRLSPGLNGNISHVQQARSDGQLRSSRLLRSCEVAHEMADAKPPSVRIWGEVMIKLGIRTVSGNRNESVLSDNRTILTAKGSNRIIRGCGQARFM